MLWSIGTIFCVLVSVSEINGSSLSNSISNDGLSRPAVPNIPGVKDKFVIIGEHMFSVTEFLETYDQDNLLHISDFDSSPEINAGSESYAFSTTSPSSSGSDARSGSSSHSTSSSSSELAFGAIQSEQLRRASLSETDIFTVDPITSDGTNLDGFRRRESTEGILREALNLSSSAPMGMRKLGRSPGVRQRPMHQKRRMVPTLDDTSVAEETDLIPSISVLNLDESNFAFSSSSSSTSNSGDRQPETLDSIPASSGTAADLQVARRRGWSMRRLSVGRKAEISGSGGPTSPLSLSRSEFDGSSS